MNAVDLMHSDPTLLERAQVRFSANLAQEPFGVRSVLHHHVAVLPCTFLKPPPQVPDS